MPETRATRAETLKQQGELYGIDHSCRRYRNLKLSRISTGLQRQKKASGNGTRPGFGAATTEKNQERYEAPDARQGSVPQSYRG